MSGLQTVVFDVGGVLIDADYRLLCRQLFDGEAEVEFFLDEVLGAEFHLQRDRGVPMADTAAEWSLRHPDFESVIQEFCDRFPEMWRGPVPGAPELVAELKEARVGVYGLTNWGRETWPLACERFPFLGSLDGVLVSSEVGITKPDPEIFRSFCARFQVTPEECVFIDDVAHNVTAARSVGFHGDRLHGHRRAAKRPRTVWIARVGLAGSWRAALTSADGPAVWPSPFCQHHR